MTQARPPAQAPIGVFDSGVGGLSILRELRAALPAEDFVYYADSAHVPYGERGDAYVAERARAVAQELIDRHGIKLLVVACNTATAAAVRALRETWPQLPMVGVEPALKPAALNSRTHQVAVMATRGTLGSDKFQQLHASLQAQAQFRLQPCDGLAAAIETFDHDAIESLCARYTQALGPFGTADGQADTLVLGCTHYTFVQPLLQRLVGPAVKILETGEPVARQARRLLLEAGLMRDAPPADPTARPGKSTAPTGRVTLVASGEAQSLHAAYDRWLGR